MFSTSSTVDIAQISSYHSEIDHRDPVSAISSNYPTCTLPSPYSSPNSDVKLHHRSWHRVDSSYYWVWSLWMWDTRIRARAIISYSHLFLFIFFQVRLLLLCFPFFSFIFFDLKAWRAIFESFVHSDFPYCRLGSTLQTLQTPFLAHSYPRHLKSIPVHHTRRCVRPRKVRGICATAC